jgi:hypothetical protein
MQKSEHQNDFYLWTQRQSFLLKNKDYKHLDWDNLAEEIEDMGRSELRQLESRLIVLVHHLLKYKYQRNKITRSWKLTIEEQRVRIETLLNENPSLRSKLTEVIEKIYRVAVIRAKKETDLDDFPNICPFTTDEIMDEAYYP